MSHLETLTPLLGIVARERTAGRPDLYDDVRQEALIRAWEVERDRPGAERTYVLAAAKHAATDAARGRRAFGAASHRGRQDAADTAGPLTRVGEDGEEVLAADPADPAAERALEAVEVGDVFPAFVRALALLEPEDRALAEERLLVGRTWPEIARARSRGANALRVRFERHVLPVLREALEDFSAVA